MDNIQKQLLDAFEASGLTYDELAKRTNLPKSALHRYFNGETEKIPIDRFQAICRELHLDARALLGWKDDHPDDPLSETPRTAEARILAKGIDRLPPEQREQALNVIRAMFSLHADYFEGNEDSTDDTEL